MPRSPLSATGRACREGPPPPPCFPAARADARARPITEPPQRMLSERPAHRAGQDTDAAKPELVQALEHRIDETVAEDLLLELVEVVLGVGHTEDLRLDGFLPAGPVGLVGVAAGQQAEREEEYEGYTGHGATVRVVPRADHGAVPASHIRALGSTLDSVGARCLPTPDAPAGAPGSA